MEIKENLTILWEYLKTVFSFDPESPLLFTQFQFWAFFAIVFAVFALFRNRRLLRNTYLFFISVLFYYKTSGLFFGLLLFVTFSDFLIAQFIHASRAQWAKKLFLILSVTIDLSILCYFKYAYFFADLVNTLCGTSFQVTNILAESFNRAVGEPVFSIDRIILPVGISFYTFQIISYTADVYKGLVKPVRNFFDFGFYVTFFPQLVAGPIVKASDFIPQLYRKYCLSRLQFGMAVFWILNGLLKKIILSDYIAVNFIDRVFENPMLFSGFENLMALFAYSLQVYADFSGYTDIAIGLSLLMGFHLPRNFNSPYKAPNCSNFWKRWHISLSRWLQTYLYIPLGGNRNSTFGTYFWILTITLAALVLSGNPYIAVGEIGIDLYWDRTYRDEQLAAFRQQVEWALEFGLPIVIHCRDAFAEVMQVLRDYASHPGLRGVFHCFTGTEAEAAAVLELPGFCFGINGVVTFKKSALAAVLRQAIPLERVVLETDSPYLAPVPCRGKRNESANIVYTARAVAEAYGKTVEEVAAGTTRNALRLFGQPEEP